MLQEKDSLAGVWNRVGLGTLMREIISLRFYINSEHSSYSKVKNTVPHYDSTKWENAKCDTIIVFTVWNAEKECLLAFWPGWPWPPGLHLHGDKAAESCSTRFANKVLGYVIPQGVLDRVRKRTVVRLSHLSVFKGSQQTLLWGFMVAI